MADAAAAVAAKLAEEAVGGCIYHIKHQFSYLSGYHQNMSNLATKVRNIEDRRVDVQTKVSRASENGENIKVTVTEWLDNVDGKKEAAEAILKDKESVGNGCWKGWFLNVNLRYRLSRKAMKMVAELDTFVGEGVFEMVATPEPALANVSDPTDTPDSNPDALESSVMQQVMADERLESRVLMLNDVMAAVRDPEIRIVRICGMGGIGKTTIANEAEKIARAGKLFQEVAMVEVNQNPDLYILQRDIAQILGLELKEDSVLARAKRLHKRLNAKEKKILLILDNIWEDVDLIKAGVPLSDKESSCKILLTSRSNLVYKNIAREQEFNLSVLPHPEDFILFRQSLGEIPHDCQKIAEDLVKACAGLPLSLTSIAGAVKNKVKVDWKVALRKLQASDLEGENKKVFRCIEVSYDFLRNEKIKMFFRLFCLFEKGSDVHIEYLLRYGVALGIFNDYEFLCEARDEACSFVETLIHANLLLCGNRSERFKVHDIVFDFAAKASSTDLFMANHGHELSKWPRKYSYKNFVAISVRCGKMFQVSEELDCRKLKLLQLTGDKKNTFSLTFPDSFLEGIPKLDILDLRGLVIPFTVKSIQCLSNIRSFSLRRCSIAVDVSMIGYLPNLELLSFAHSMITELPVEIGNLKKLRLLDLSKCSELLEIAPGVLKQLSSLEELYMRGTGQLFKSGSRAIYSEIKSLKTLSVLHIEMLNDVLPMDDLFEMLKNFKISIYREDNLKPDKGYRKLQNSLHLETDASVLRQSGIKRLLMEAVRLNLRITGLEILFPLNEPKINLRILNLFSCNKLVYLMHAVGIQEQYNIFPELVALYLYTLPCLKDIFRAPNFKVSIVCPFRNLEFLEVRDCHLLEHIFTLSIARGLSKLLVIKISDCKNLKLIFAKEGECAGTVEFPNLKYMICKNLPELVGCHDASDRVEFPRLKDLKLENLPMITSLIKDGTGASTSIDGESSSIHPFFTNKGSGTAIRLQNLFTIIVHGCRSLRYLSTLTTAISFESLELISVLNCQLFEEVVAADGKNKDDESGIEALFPKLKVLLLEALPSLSKCFPEGCTLNWSSLESILLVKCGTKLVKLCYDENDKKRVSTTGDKIVSSSLETLNVSGTTFMEFWPKQKANLSRRDEQFAFFSHNLILLLKNLKSVNLGDIKSVEVVFDFEEEFIVDRMPNVAILPKLETVKIDSLPNMTLLWKNVPKNIEKFGNLTSLRVCSCDSLRYLFFHSTAKYLVKLKKIYTGLCLKIEEFVSERDEEGQEKRFDILLFPQLETLEFHHLPCLRFLGPGVCDFNKLSFEVPDIIENEKNPVTGTTSTLVRSEAFRRCWSLHNLTSLTVTYCGNMFSLFQPNLQVILPALETLNIEYCNALKYVFSSSTATHFQQLQRLRIIECNMMEEIVEVEDEEVGKIVFPSLESIDLGGLSSLKGFCLGTLLFDWPSLKSVEIYDCLEMGMFTSGHSETPVLDKVIINLNPHSLAEGESNINTAFKKCNRKGTKHNNRAFYEEGILISTLSFRAAGVHLITQCPSWQWLLGCKVQPVRIQQYILEITDAQCLKRARTTKLLCSPRKYYVAFTYDQDDKSPVLWVEGYNEEDEVLPLECVLEDIAEHYPTEYVPVKQPPHWQKPPLDPTEKQLPHWQKPPLDPIRYIVEQPQHRQNSEAST